MRDMNLDNIYISTYICEKAIELGVNKKLFNVIKSFVRYKNSKGEYINNPSSASVFIDNISDDYILPHFNDYNAYRIPCEFGFMLLQYDTMYGQRYETIHFVSDVYISVEFLDYSPYGEPVCVTKLIESED